MTKLIANTSTTGGLSLGLRLEGIRPDDDEVITAMGEAAIEVLLQRMRSGLMRQSDGPDAMDPQQAVDAMREMIEVHPTNPQHAVLLVRDPDALRRMCNGQGCSLEKLFSLDNAAQMELAQFGEALFLRAEQSKRGSPLFRVGSCTGKEEPNRTPGSIKWALHLGIGTRSP